MIFIDKIEDADSENESPPKMIKQTVPKKQTVPIKQNIPKPGRRVMLVEDDNDDNHDSDASNSSLDSNKPGAASTESKLKEKKQALLQQVVVNPVSEMNKPVRTKPKISPTKRDRKAPVMLYRPPALKDRGRYFFLKFRFMFFKFGFIYFFVMNGQFAIINVA